MALNAGNILNNSPLIESLGNKLQPEAIKQIVKSLQGATYSIKTT